MDQLWKVPKERAFLMKVAIVIPARMGSSRLYGKPLKLIAGQTLLERVWRIARAVACSFEELDVLIATDHLEIAAAAESFGAEVVMTSEDCRTGTDRVAEVASQRKFDIFCSFQGDAVLTPPWVIADVLEEMRQGATMATAAVLTDGEEAARFIAEKAQGSSSGTTVVVDKEGYALYFSKVVLPHKRGGGVRPFRRHIGLYAYQRDTLLQLSSLPESELESLEKLEQLRALENGIRIKVADVDYRGRSHGSIDNPEDIALVESIIAREGELVP